MRARNDIGDVKMRALPLGLATLIAIMAAAPVVARQSTQERGEAELAKQVAGRVPGKPVQCISLSSSDGSTIIDGTAIVYRGLGGKLYVNRPRGAEMLREDDIPVQYVYGSQLCRMDRIKLLDRSTRMERGFASLGDFVPYTKPAKVD
jgi:hypothetical protein